MKMNCCKRILAIVMTSTLCACSGVNSVQPFDQEQAAIWAAQNPAPRRTQDTIALQIPKQPAWRKVDLSFEQMGAPLMFIPADEELANWHESIRGKIFLYHDNEALTINQFFAHEIKTAQKWCQVNGKILSQSKNSVFYLINLTHCTNQDSAVMVGKAFQGNDAIYVVYYTNRNQPITPAKLQFMSDLIANAQLVSQSRR